MGKIVCGVDLSKPVTPIMARDAIILCFLEAHKKDLDELGNYGSMSSDELEKMKRIDVETMIRKDFDESGGDFDNPTKQSLIAVCDKLAAFASNFRQQTVIKRHYNQIMQIVEKIG